MQKTVEHINKVMQNIDKLANEFTILRNGHSRI